MQARAINKILIPLAIALVSYLGLGGTTAVFEGSANQSDSSDILYQAFENQQSDLQVQGTARVVKVLPDDTKGSQHQRFIVETNQGQSILIAHNIDLAPRVANLSVGDTVEFFGEYEWNNRGGVIHWTHHDPKNRHPHGWIKHNGETYR